MNCLNKMVMITLAIIVVGSTPRILGMTPTDTNALTDIFIKEMKQYFEGKQGLVNHTLAVYGYAEQIRQVEGGDVLTVRGAAIYHDIGIPEAGRIHGSSAGKYQEIEGPPIAKKILSDLSLDKKKMDFICRIIANHHTAHDEKTIATIEFKIIWDADALVNLRRKQGVIGKKEFRRIIQQTFRTETGLQLAKALFLAEAQDVADPGKNQESQEAAQRNRVIVLTDFHKDPDDKQSMIRFLTYANEFDVEGLIATSLAYGDGQVHPEWIEDIIDEYGKVLGNLRHHERPGFTYPSVRYLKNIVKEGAPVARKYRGRNKGFSVPYPKGAKDPRSCDPASKWIGPDKDTAASNHIINVVDKKDSRPVWIVVWGGPMDLAQAVWRVRHERTAAQTADFVSKLRLYQISWQDTGAVWIWEQFPKLFYIQSSEGFRGMYQDNNPAYKNQKWIDENVKNNHGPLGAQYPKAGRIDGIKEGDTPSFLYLLAPGLSDPEHPEWGGWGGRFKAYGDGTNFYIDARDKHPEKSDATLEKRWTVARWNQQRNQEFAARMDWCVKDYANANHNPVAHLNGNDSADVQTLSARSGQTVHLSANGSHDPDGDELSYHWWQYEEADSYEGSVDISGSTLRNASFTAPSVNSSRTIHIILEVTDNGTPNLTNYRRLVITVNPDGKP